MSAPVAPEVEHGTLTILPPELRPSVEHLVTEDDTPVDSVYSEKQMRLLTRPLYSSWTGLMGDGMFLALANVGMFFGINQPPLVPDVLLSVGVKVPDDIREKRHRSYFFWEYGKSPEAVIEVVSNLEGNELGLKKKQYARIGIPIYVVWDPLQLLSKTALQVFGLRLKSYETTSPSWFDDIGLGLQVWHGEFEHLEADWLRWCDKEGQLIPLGEERAEQEKLRAERERMRAEQERMRAEQEKMRAEQEKMRAEQEKMRSTQAEQRAAQADQRAARLVAQLRNLGVEPGNGNE
jgi:Putative restriction endonuclease